MNLFFDFLALAASFINPAQSAPDVMSLNVAGEERTFMVAGPEKSKDPAPLVIAFHGKGGQARAQRARFDIDRRWPDAIVIYPNGLKRAAPLYDPKGEKSGWSVEDSDSNPDIKFFDELVAWAKKHRNVDAKRITVTGHSNGGFFSYLLGARRNSVLAGIAPSSATGARFASRLNGLPVFHLAGKEDQLVSYRGQKLTIDTILRTRDMSSVQPTVKGELANYGSGVKRVVVFTHEGGHTPPVESVPPLVDFLKSCKRAS